MRKMLGVTLKDHGINIWLRETCDGKSSNVKMQWAGCDEADGQIQWQMINWRS